MSFSPSSTPSASASVFSLPLSSPESSPKTHYRLLRGLSMADAEAVAREALECDDAAEVRAKVRGLLTRSGVRS